MKHLSKKSVILIILIQIFYFTDKSCADPDLVFVSIAPQKYFVERIGGNEVQVEVNATSVDDADNITAEVKIITNKDGVQTKVSSVISGSESEVNQTVKDLVAEAQDN